MNTRYLIGSEIVCSLACRNLLIPKAAAALIAQKEAALIAQPKADIYECTTD